MLFIKRFSIISLLIFCFLQSKSQIGVTYLTAKNFKAIGYGGYLDLGVPVSNANNVTLTLGYQYFKDKYEETLEFIPVLAGFQYTFNQEGYGFYVEPNVGYCFGNSTIQVYENNSPVSDGNGGWKHEMVKGPSAGITIGYLSNSTGIFKMNIGLLYERTFGSFGTNLFSFKITHSLSFGRNNSDY